MINSFFERRVNTLFDVADRFEAALAQAGIEYRIVGGLAVYLHVESAEPDAGRLTPGVDAAVDRRDVEPIIAAAHEAGIDIVLDRDSAGALRAVRLVFVGETVPGFTPPAVFRSRLLVAPVADLVLMKLTSFRLKDRVHIQDLDAAGLITPEIEERLPEILRERLREVRASE